MRRFGVYRVLIGYPLFRVLSSAGFDCRDPVLADASFSVTLLVCYVIITVVKTFLDAGGIMSITALFLLQPRIWMIAVLFFMFRSQVDTPAPEASNVFAGPVKGMEFAYIPSGSFMMGLSSSEEAQHRVDIPAFEMMTTEVTQGMWEEVMGSDTRYQCQLIDPDWTPAGEGSNYPMHLISWLECQEFIEELNGLDTLFAYRLPTESEWEYACRAGTATRYYWGNSDAETTMKRYCWYSRNANENHWTSPHAAEGGSQPVGMREPNSWGLYDMAGNVYEWCEDNYHNDYSGAPSDGSVWLDEDCNTTRVIRGGDWINSADDCRSASRNFHGEDTQSLSWGFRVARSAR